MSRSLLSLVGGVVVEARGSAELKLAARQLRLSQSLEAVATLRSGLKALQVQELEVTSPSTLNRPAQRERLDRS